MVADRHRLLQTVAVPTYPGCRSNVTCKWICDKYKHKVTYTLRFVDDKQTRPEQFGPKVSIGQNARELAGEEKFANRIITCMPRPIRFSGVFAANKWGLSVFGIRSKYKSTGCSCGKYFLLFVDNQCDAVIRFSSGQAQWDRVKS